jgi:VIT1/CCC1 family predicted Fe2+/Mn2+ transporter
MSAVAAEQPGGCGKIPTQLTAHRNAISTRRDMKREPGIHTEQRETHRSGRVGWLRAAVLGPDDAIVSTASLMIGVAAASASKGAILVAGVAGLVAGAMSMAVSEYVSVSSGVQGVD